MRCVPCRTASTLLHEAGFDTDWIEKRLALEQRCVLAIYNMDEQAEQTRMMRQARADMLDRWIKDGPHATFTLPATDDISEVATASRPYNQATGQRRVL